MVGRIFCFLVTSLLLTATGCTFPIAGLRTESAPAAKAGPEGENGPTHKASTWVAFGDFRASAGFSPEYTPQQQKQFRDDARKAYQSALEIDPKHQPAFLALARLQQASEDYAGAVATFHKALALNGKDAPTWYELGLCLCRQKNWNEAVGCLAKAVEQTPGNRQYSMTLGYTLARAGRWNDSLALLAQVQGEARAHYDMARMLEHLNQPALARQQCLLAIQKDTSLPGVREFLAKLENNSSPHQAGSSPAAVQTASTPAAHPVQTATLVETTSPATAAPVHTAAYTEAQPASVSMGGGNATGNAVNQATAPRTAVIPVIHATVRANGTISQQGKPIRMPPCPVIKIPAR